MTIDELLDRRLIFIAGKGGVGKSTMAAVLGVTAARRGKRVCLVETDAQEQMARLFRSDPAGHRGKTLAPNIRALSITTEGALREFAGKRLPLHRLSSHLINNRLVRYFLDATPGLKELLSLGKIADIVEQSDDDVTIVDLPATGHGRAMLSVPDVVMRVVHAGPLHRQAEQTRATINDPDISAVCFVTIAEELAVAETIELRDALAHDMDIALGPVIANGVHMPLVEAAERRAYEGIRKRWISNTDTKAVIDAAELACARAALNRRYLDALTAAFKQRPIVIPLLFIGSIDADALAHLSDLIAVGGAS